MKKAIVVLLFIIVCLSASKYASALIPCQCNNPPEQCTCFIQLGDKGLAVKNIISVLRDKGYLGKLENNSEFTPEVKQAVIKFQSDNNLECTGWMDDDTLNVLLNNVLPDEKYIYPAEFWEAICFVPTDGGRKHHANPFCSDMYNPRMISRVNAMSLGIEPCGKETCTKHSALLYSTLGLKPRQLPDEYYSKEDEQETNLEASIQVIQPDDSQDRTVPSDDSELIYIGNKNSHVFHRGTCQSVIDMKEKNKISFMSREEAIEKGYRPCSRCQP